MEESSTRWSWWGRLSANLAALAVGLVAAILSWRHIVHTASTYGHEPAWAAMLYPVPIDGMMIVGVAKAADDRRTGRLVRPWARVATWFGGILSISNQMASAYVWGWVAIAVAVIPSGALITTVEVMARRGKLMEEAKVKARAEAEAALTEVTPAPVSIETPPVVPETTPVPQPQAQAPIAEPVTEPEPVVEPEPIIETFEVVEAPRRRRRPSARAYPGVSDEVIEATIMEHRERGRVEPAFIGPPVVDAEADME